MKISLAIIKLKNMSYFPIDIANPEMKELDQQYDNLLGISLIPELLFDFPVPASIHELETPISSELPKMETGCSETFYTEDLQESEAHPMTISESTIPDSSMNDF